MENCWKYNEVWPSYRPSCNSKKINWKRVLICSQLSGENIRSSLCNILLVFFNQMSMFFLFVDDIGQFIGADVYVWFSCRRIRFIEKFYPRINTNKSKLIIFQIDFEGCRRTRIWPNTIIFPQLPLFCYSMYYYAWILIISWAVRIRLK